LVEQAAFSGGATGFADEFDGIDFQEEGGCAAILRSFRKKDVGFAKRETDRMKSAWTFVEEKAQVSSGSLRGGDG